MADLREGSGGEKKWVELEYNLMQNQWDLERIKDISSSLHHWLQSVFLTKTQATFLLKFNNNPQWFLTAYQTNSKLCSQR